MLNKNLIIGGIIILLGIVLIKSEKVPFVGSVGQTGEYQATTTASITGGTGLAARIQRSLTSCTATTLGSVVIASSTNATFRIWNATSTTDTGSTTLVIFPASVAAGTYTFDSIMTRGVVIDMPAGFAGDYVVTCR